MWHTLFEMGNDGRLWTMFKMDLENVQNTIRAFVQHVGNNCCNQGKTSSGVITYTAPTEPAEERCSIQFDDDTTTDNEPQPSLEQNVAVEESSKASIEVAEGLNNVESKIFIDATHGIPWTHDQELVEELDRFLEL